MSHQPCLSLVMFARELSRAMLAIDSDVSPAVSISQQSRDPIQSDQFLRSIKRKAASMASSAAFAAMLLLRLLAVCLSVVLVHAQCTSPRQRKEWTALTDTEKRNYITAVRCLHDVPSVTDYKGAISKFDDFQATHIGQVTIIHGVGQFLPWHRYMMWAYEEALVNDCGYTGAQPYWNETKDAGAFTKSPLLQANDLSFGGDGVATNSNCVATGPFSNLTLHLGPGNQVTNHCLNRAVSDRSSTSASQTDVNKCFAMTTFATAWPCIENNGVHGAGHAGVGAEMVNVQSAPADPIFYMHHTWIDKLWADWQAKSPTTRTNDIAGYTTQSKPYTNTTLTYVMTLEDIVPDVTVSQVMDTTGDYLCYEYV